MSRPRFKYVFSLFLCVHKYFHCNLGIWSLPSSITDFIDISSCFRLRIIIFFVFGWFNGFLNLKQWTGRSNVRFNQLSRSLTAVITGFDRVLAKTGLKGWSNRFFNRSTVQPVEPAGLVRVLKHWLRPMRNFIIRSSSLYSLRAFIWLQEGRGRYVSNTSQRPLSFVK